MANTKRFVAKNGLDANTKTITNVSAPENATDAANKAFSSNASNLESGTVPSGRMTGTYAISISGNAATATTAVSATTANTATTANRLTNSVNINGVAFDGSASITLKSSTTNVLSAGGDLLGGSFDGSAGATFSVNSSVSNAANTIVKRSAEGYTYAVRAFIAVGQTTPTLANELVAKEYLDSRTSTGQSGAAPFYSARAFVSFNGTTFDGSNVVPMYRAANVTSVVLMGGTGRTYRVNLTTPLPSADSVAVTSCTAGNDRTNQLGRVSPTGDNIDTSAYVHFQSKMNQIGADTSNRFDKNDVVIFG